MAIEPETGQAIVDNSLYWWHQASLKALDQWGPLYPAAVADATKSFTMDAEKYLSQLERAGMVERVEAPAMGPGINMPEGVQWWAITDRGTDWATD